MNVKEYLSGVFKSGRESHFYLFSNPEDLQSAVSVIFCDHKTACGKCEGCRILAEGNPFDLNEVRPDENGKIKDEAIEEVLSLSDVMPTREFRVIAIYSADAMTERAQNRLLKSLEEGPDTVIYLMETDKFQRLLPTVVSRASRIRGGSRRVGADGSGEGTVGAEIAKALVKGSGRAVSELFTDLFGVKKRRADVVEGLDNAADELAAIWRDRVSRGAVDEAARLFRLHASVAEAAGNIEKNGNIEQNLSLLTWGHFGERIRN